jgi:hypothetical protein
MRETSQIVLLLAVLVFQACGPSTPDAVEKDSLFSMISSKESGIDFQNTLTDTREFNIYTYRNFYNGGGVAIGDINNDNLPDIFLTSNMNPNKLYLNLGEFRFKDITEEAGVGGTRKWSTGVNMVDINADGLLDIYVSNSGDIESDDRANELYINNGDLTFTEKAAEVGLDERGLTTHAAFFDYDKDGDLDAYILNNSFRAIGSFDLRTDQRDTRDSLGGHKLLRNDNGRFTDVSVSANIYGSAIGFGLGVSVSDFNQDTWPDLYICNDFFERDYLYINNKDGSFREVLTEGIRSISMASMGVDAADLTGDGFPEIFVTEMLPKDESRLKTSMTFENWNKIQFNAEHGYHHQFTRNMLHVNMGLSEGRNPRFTEVGRMCNVEATDWSWSSLICDLDNNGYKDIFITNGVYKDILNQDYLRYVSSEMVFKSMATSKGIDYKKLIDIIPSKPISNVMYSGDGYLSFNDSTKQWGLNAPGFSNGAAYGDLDNDGDLDLVVNNVNMPVFLYRNQTHQKFPTRHFLKINLRGVGKNSFGIGATVTLARKGTRHMQEQLPTRGFQSSMDYTMLFGLGTFDVVDTLMIRWPSGAIETRYNVRADQTLVLSETDALGTGKFLAAGYQSDSPGKVGPHFNDISANYSDDFGHVENKHSDFDIEPLLFHMNSTEGPRVAKGDINGDNIEDVYIGGAKNCEKKLFIGRSDGSFIRSRSKAFEQDKRCEDTDALFFDADNDGDLDLYVASGSNEYSTSSSALSDRLYFNSGKGEFTKSKQPLPTSSFTSTSCVSGADFDLDGDIDLFVGGRVRFREYGRPQHGYLLENDGKGIFQDVTAALAPELRKIGMIRDAVFGDVDGDKRPDLVLTGEWMPVSVFMNKGDGFRNATKEVGLANYLGWWNRLYADDLDGDGDMDFVVGNLGLNSRFRASVKEPITCYINDFDKNGTIEQITTTYNQGSAYPMVLWHDLVTQVPSLKKNFLKYEDYQLKSMEEIFSVDRVNSSLRLSVNTLESVALINDSGTFTVKPLPREAQLSPVYAIYSHDFNDDGIQDILLGGNLLEVKPEIGRYDASYGTLLLGKGDGSFSSASNVSSNLFLNGQVRDIVGIRPNLLLVVRNNAPVQILRVNDSKSKIIPFNQ